MDKSREALLFEYRKRKSIIKRRLQEFRNVPREDYFYEMVYCLLTPQTSAKAALEAVKKLKLHNFQQNDIDAAPLLHSPDFYVRFHRTKALWLSNLKRTFSTALKIIDKSNNGAFEKRLELVKLIKGYGLKEATHFLRNIGKNEDLAILDRHILKNLYKYRVIENIPKNLSPKNYFVIEENFRTFAVNSHIPLDELDLLFWGMETGTILK